MNPDGRRHVLDIYQLADLPISLSPSLQLNVAPAAQKLLAISPETHEWRTMSASDLFSCSKLGTFYLCPLTGVLRNPLPNERTPSIDDDACLFHLFVGHFKGASSACDSSVREKRLGVTQTGPFTFAAFAPPSAPVLGEAVCPADPSFRRTLLISNLTTFSLPPSCEMSLGSFRLYSADQSFIRKGTGTAFAYPFPEDLIGGNISKPELESVKSSLTVARSLAKETRLESWKRARQMRSLLSSVGYESYLALLLSGGSYIAIFVVTAVFMCLLLKLHRRTSILEGHYPRNTAPRSPARRAIQRLAPKRRRTTDPLFQPVDIHEETPFNTPPPPSTPVYPVLPNGAPTRITSAPAAIAVNPGAPTSGVSRSSSPPPPSYVTIGTEKP